MRQVFLALIICALGSSGARADPSIPAPGSDAAASFHGKLRTIGSDIRTGFKRTERLRTERLDKLDSMIHAFVREIRARHGVEAAFSGQTEDEAESNSTPPSMEKLGSKQRIVELIPLFRETLDTYGPAVRTALRNGLRIRTSPFSEDTSGRCGKAGGSVSLVIPEKDFVRWEYNPPMDSPVKTGYSTVNMARSLPEQVKAALHHEFAHALVPEQEFLQQYGKQWNSAWNRLWEREQRMPESFSMRDYYLRGVVTPYSTHPWEGLAEMASMAYTYPDRLREIRSEYPEVESNYRLFKKIYADRGVPLPTRMD